MTLPSWQGPGPSLTDLNNPPPKQRRSRWPWVVAFVLLLLCGFGVFAAIGALGPTTTATPGAVVTTAAPAPETQDRVKAVQSAHPAIGEGGYLVGTDVKAGRYRTPGAAKSVVVYCLWTVHAGGDPDGEITSYGQVDKTTAPGNVTLKKGDYFQTQGCQDWTLR